MPFIKSGKRRQGKTRWERSPENCRVLDYGGTVFSEPTLIKLLSVIKRYSSACA